MYSECTIWSKDSDIKRVSLGVVGCLGVFRRTLVLVIRLTASILSEQSGVKALIPKGCPGAS